MNINDILCYRPEHYQKARNILKQLPVDCRSLAIAGESGTGKSEIAQIISRAFNKPYIMALDQYYNIPAYKRTKWRKKNLDKVGPNEIDWEAVEHDVKNIKSDIIIYEGLYACNTHAEFKVFLSGTYEDTKKFRTKRKKERQSRFRQRVLEREHEEVKKTLVNATLII